MPDEKCVLAYSGGLDTSGLIPYIKETYGYDVIAVLVDVGRARDLEALRQRALRAGAVDALVIDAKEEFARDFVAPALRANALYEEKYPLVAALSRPLISKKIVDVAHDKAARPKATTKCVSMCPCAASTRV
jgi:argininosuccinate synthase